MKPLEIQPLPRGESSDSIILTKSFIEAAKADNASKSKLSSRRNILMFNRVVGRGFRSEPERRSQSQLLEVERMSAIGRMACSISHDMRHLLSAIYANAEFLERHDICASARADMVLDIREAVLAMTERIDSLLQFGSSGRKTPLVHERVSWVVEKAVAAAKMHPDAHDVSTTVGTFSPAEADIDARSLEGAIYNLLLNACQAAARSINVPEVKVRLTEVDERIYVTIQDNGPGIPASVSRTLFDPFVTAGKPNGTGLGLTLARRIAEEHGGSVCLEESNPEGAVFTLSLMKNRLLTLARGGSSETSRHSVFTEERGLRFDHTPQINWRGSCYYLDGFRKGAVVAHRERISGYLCRPKGGNAKPFLRRKGVCRAKG